MGKVTRLLPREALRSAPQYKVVPLAMLRRCAKKRKWSLRDSNPKSSALRFATKIASGLRGYEGSKLPRNYFSLLQWSAISGIVVDANCPENAELKKTQKVAGTRTSWQRASFNL